MHLNHSGVHCQSRHEGLEILHIKDALARYDGLPQYYWKLLDPDRDEFTRATRENLHGGYFIRARAGVKIEAPVQSCLFIKGSGTGQNVHNIVVVEEGAELNILGGCATAHGTREVAHLGVTEFFVERGGKLSFTMIHNWGEGAAVRPRSAGVMDEDAVFLNNYILLKPVADLQMYPSIMLRGRRAVARFNSVILAPPGSHVDSGNRIHLDAPDTRGEILSRTLTTGGVIINRGFIGASAVPARGHLECKGLILGQGRIHAIPELDAATDGVELSHEAAVGKIAQEEIEYLMARGLDEDEATATIVRGFLNVDIMGLPPALKAAIDAQLETLNANAAL
jgi:Fe-S cluster assembly scaffold protein SufB